MNQTAALQGDALYALLDQAKELVYDDNGPGDVAISREERMAAAAELLEQQTYAPASVDELERLHDFLAYLGRNQTASQLLDAHRDRVLAAESDPSRHAHGDIRLALSDIQSRTEFDKPAAIALLMPTLKKIEALPDQDESNYWDFWQTQAHKLQAWEMNAIAIDMRRARERRDPDLADDAAFRDALACVRKAELAQRAGKPAEVGPLVQTAINTLRDAPADQHVEFDQWMQLADQSLPLAAQSLPSLLMACEQQLAQREQPAPSQAIKAHRKVRIVRLQAQACAQAGQLEAALQLAPQGHFGLTDDAGDPFTALHLEWLVQAGHMEEAANLAMECVLHARPVSAVTAYHLARQRFDTDPTRSITWALILAMGGIDEDMRQLLAQEDMAAHPPEFYMNMVRAAQPQHPVLAVIEGMKWASKRKMEQALPLLEQSVGLHPEFADTDKLPALWAARFAVLPLEEALARPFPESHGGHWCYAAGVVLDDEDDLAPLMGGKKNVPSEEVREPLVVRYYEMGLARFEHFWATNQGAFKDADLHVYSMLCNNLAIKYRFAERYDDAAALHRKGLESSPFAEHQDGLMWSAILKDDDAEIVAEAERLWHFVQDHGYGRHDPTNYFSTVAMSLYKLDRDDEISIWLERLDQWFEELDEEEQQSERRDYLATLMSMLDFQSSTRPELVLPRLRAHQAEVTALRDCYPLRRLACALEAYPEHLEESLALHKQASTFLDKDDDEDERRMTREGIARAERKIGERDAEAGGQSSGRKPWWKFW